MGINSDRKAVKYNLIPLLLTLFVILFKDTDSTAPKKGGSVQWTNDP